VTPLLGMTHCSMVLPSTMASDLAQLLLLGRDRGLSISAGRASYAADKLRTVFSLPAQEAQTSISLLQHLRKRPYLARQTKQ
jgi:hypothetical protein